MTRLTQFEHEERRAPPERRETLWLLTLGPAIWIVYFLLSYITAAIWCAKIADRAGMLGGARIAIGIYAVLALLGIGIVIWRALRRARFGTGTVPHDADSAADRHRFLGFATLLLCGLSAVATVYVAFAAVFIESCR
nr:hypothetical protein [uncultured Halomonas sp.]